MNRKHIGGRGEPWVLIQVLLFAVFLLMPQVGPGWPAPTMFRILGASAVLGGIAVLGSSAVSLGKSLTPFPRPLPSAQFVTSGAYQLVRHPMYFGLLLAALGISLLTMSPLRIALTLLLGVFRPQGNPRRKVVAGALSRLSGVSGQGQEIAALPLLKHCS